MAEPPVTYDRPWGYANPQAGVAADHLKAHQHLGLQIRADWAGIPVGPDDRVPEVTAISRSLYQPEVK